MESRKTKAEIVPLGATATEWTRPWKPKHCTVFGLSVFTPHKSFRALTKSAKLPSPDTAGRADNLTGSAKGTPLGPSPCAASRRPNAVWDVKGSKATNRVESGP